jgi:hypothetical protein
MRQGSTGVRLMARLLIAMKAEGEGGAVRAGGHRKGLGTIDEGTFDRCRATIGQPARPARSPDACLLMSAGLARALTLHCHVAVRGIDPDSRVRPPNLAGPIFDRIGSGCSLGDVPSVAALDALLTGGALNRGHDSFRHGGRRGRHHGCDRRHRRCRPRKLRHLDSIGSDAASFIDICRIDKRAAGQFSFPPFRL